MISVMLTALTENHIQVHQLRLDKDEHLYRAFKHYDKDNSGFITEQELRDALSCKGGGTADVDRILRDIDTDHDGRINYQEFCNCVRMRMVRTEDRY